jgi:hypothetical protein
MPGTGPPGSPAGCDLRFATFADALPLGAAAA